jgi:hypothetical protein
LDVLRLGPYVFGRSVFGRYVFGRFVDAPKKYLFEQKIMVAGVEGLLKVIKYEERSMGEQ